MENEKLQDDTNIHFILKKSIEEKTLLEKAFQKNSSSKHIPEDTLLSFGLESEWSRNRIIKRWYKRRVQ